MADKQRLRLTLRDTVRDRTWSSHPVEVTADPDDHDVLRDHIERLARSLDHRTGEPWWIGEYEADVQSLDETWRKFTLPGGI